MDNKTGLLRLKHMLLSAARYPVNYGFVPQTIEADGDALDILVINQDAIHPLTIVDARVIGGMTIHSSEKGDEERILSVDAHDPLYTSVNSITELAPHLLEEIVQFFETFKSLEGTKIKMKELYTKRQARMVIERSHGRYRKRLLVSVA